MAPTQRNAEEGRNVIIMNVDNLEIVKLIISILSIVATSVFNLATIIVTCHNAEKQVKESEKVLEHQKEQYRKEKLYNKETIRIQKRPYLVIDKSSRCICNGNKDHHMIICFKNKGNGSAFKIEPALEITASNGNIIMREEPIQDPIVMVNEVCETKWTFDSQKRNFEFPINLKYEDMSAQLYEQTFILTLDDRLHIMVKNYAEPQLVNK